METKKIFYVFITVILIFLSCKNSTDSEKNTRTYVINKILGLTIDEYIQKYQHKPRLEKIKLVNYKKGDTDLSGKVLLRDIGWLDIDHLSSDGDQFIVYTEGTIDKVEHLWFMINSISKDQIEGVYVVCGREIDGFPIEFSGYSQ